MKPSDIAALGLPIPAKLKDLAARGGTYPSKGKYGLVSVSDDDINDRVLIGPNYFAQSRLSEKDLNSDSDFENDRAEIDDIEDDRETSRRPYNEEDVENSRDNFDNNSSGDRQVEPVDNSESENPYGFNYGKHPLFPPTYEGIYNLPNPYLPPYNFNIPIPLLNQYLQRRAYNSGLRYSSAAQHPGAYGQQQFNPNPQPYSPFSRYFFVQ